MPDLHPRAREVAESFAAAVGEHAGEGAALVAYGSAVRGDFDSERSDVDVLVALPDASAERLEAIGPAVREAWWTGRLDAYIVRTGELARLADVFPIQSTCESSA